MTGKLMQLLRDEGGLTTVEYAVAAALISAVLVSAFALLGGQVEAVITFITGNFG